MKMQIGKEKIQTHRHSLQSTFISTACLLLSQPQRIPSFKKAGGKNAFPPPPLMHRGQSDERFLASSIEVKTISVAICLDLVQNNSIHNSLQSKINVTFLLESKGIYSIRNNLLNNCTAIHPLNISCKFKKKS